MESIRSPNPTCLRGACQSAPSDSGGGSIAAFGGASLAKEAAALSQSLAPAMPNRFSPAAIIFAADRNPLGRPGRGE